MADIPAHIKEMFDGEKPLTPEQTTEYITWLQLNRRPNEIITHRPSLEIGPSALDARVSWYMWKYKIYGDVKFILTKHINKIKPALGAILEILQHVDGYWWSEIWDSKFVCEIIDFLCEQDIPHVYEINLYQIGSHIPQIAYLNSKGFVYSTVGDREFNRYTGDHSHSDICRDLIEYHKNFTKLREENAKLHAEIAELRLRPPELGGPDYEAAKSRFAIAQNLQI